MFQTPNIDILAKEGIRFTRAYAGAPECAPSRASLMTGKHMGHCRIRANRSVRGQDHLLKSDITVAEILKKVGYTTGFIGKWGIGLPGTEGVPYKKGFDFAYGFYDQRRAHTYFPDYIMENEKKILLPGNFGFNMERVYKYNGRPVDKIEGVENIYDEKGLLIPDGVADPEKVVYSEELFQKAALSFIKNNKDKRFFLYYATQIPHGPCIAPDIGKFKDKDWPLKNKEWAAMMTYLDNGVGNILRLLKELEIDKNTVIFFAGDNGYSEWGYFGRKAWLDDPLFHNKGPWRGGKFITMEGGVRVPFFVYWPEHIQPRESDHICALYDFLATAADLAGIREVPENDGITLVPELENLPRKQKKHEYLYWENGTHNPHGQAVRMGKWRGYRSSPDKPVELYLIDQDSASSHNVADEHPDVVRKIETIFKKAHRDSKWYINPGDDKECIKRKKEEAIKSKTMQVSTKANSTFKNN